MRLLLLLLILGGLAACSESDTRERYRAERNLYRVEEPFLQMRFEERIETRRQWREFARDFEAVATSVKPSADPDLLAIEGRAWMRAAECHFAAVDSERAELILATLAANQAEVPKIFGEVSLRLGRIAEQHGQYLAALGRYQNVVDLVDPDPGPDPDDYRDPDARPEEETAGDFVLELPLRMARIASRDIELSDPDRYYAQAMDYYSEFVGDRSAFIRVESAILLAETEADRGDFEVAIQILRELEHQIPYVVRVRHAPDAVRRTAFEYRVQSWIWGRVDRDQVQEELDALIAEYPVGNAAGGALYAMARGAEELEEFELSLELLDRLHRDYPTSTHVPDAELLRGRLLEESGDWRAARQTLRTLIQEFPTSAAALRAPMEIVNHHERVGDRASRAEALDRAEQYYREVLVRYPAGDHTFLAREKLVQTLTLQERDGDALDELLALCDEVATPAQRPGLLADAARRAETRLGEPARAAAILERLAEEFPNTRLGRWSVRQARRLREAQTR